ncbi:AraC family transcriptional regulator [Paralimibaculum aggregatum]|uniref:AraC family transcriptional regulator n=1 Tax=Paralimibaculum aggregatum TaxID=3036245 RepID=A0ABQ6LHB8_9RHOB|nr:AraC family transcriptional regulator [Limibaculum sp. NKW23]GMG82680.1 AraC family transcriptional regulator [Limibaculum sp. NKW23]
MDPALDIRAYDGPGQLHSHEIVQLVLPMEGALELEIAGHGARLSPALSAFIAPGERHTQAGHGPNRSLVLEAPAAAFPPAVLERLGRQRFFAPAPALRSLVEFADLRSRAAGLGTGDLAALARLLTGTLGAEPERPAPRDRLAAAIRRDPAADWPVARLAREAGMSRSALYRALAAGGESPGRFVTRIRLEAALADLADPRLPLAGIALRCGFSDQAALTRAMRRETGRTPGAWRRQIGTPGQARGT